MPLMSSALLNLWFIRRKATGSGLMDFLDQLQRFVIKNNKPELYNI